MTTREADFHIKTGEPVKVHHTEAGGTFYAIFTGRDRRMIKTVTGGLYKRVKLEIIPEGVA